MKSTCICALLIVLFACRPAEQPAADTSATEVVETAAQPSPETAATQPAAPATVAVTLTEFRIDMPSSIPAGPTRFEITNSGKVEHNFEIEGPGIEQKLETNLKAGQSGTLEVDLKPGTYQVYCPVRDHATKRGMTMQLTVT